MAPFTLPQDSTFPTGTSVSAYLYDSDTEGQPSGSPLDTQTMNGSVTFNGLVEGRSYWAIGTVSGQLRRKEFYVPVTPVVNVRESELQIFNVLNPPYNAMADATHITGADGYPGGFAGTDNTPLAQLAIDAAVAAGGGEVRFPRGDYYFHATRSASGILYHLIIYGDNVRVVLEQGARLFSDAGSLTGFFIQMGWAKGDTPAAAAGRGGVLGDQWRTAYWFSKTAKLISNVAKGDATIQFTTHADAAIAAGHIVKILTGAIGGGTTPDAELTESAGGDAGTGILRLRRPATRHYEQEWVASADVLTGVAAGNSNRTPTAFPAPFGVIDIDSSCIRGGGLAGPGEIHGQNVGKALQYYSVFDGPICSPFPRCINISAYDGQDSRDALFDRPFMDSKAAVSVYGQSTGCWGARHLHPRMINRVGTVTFEASEGSGGWRWINPKHENAPDGASDQRSASLGLRNRDCYVEAPDILNHTHGIALLMSDDGSAPEIATQSPNFMVRPCVRGVIGTYAGRVIGNTWRVIDDRTPNTDQRVVVAGSDHGDQAPLEVYETPVMITFADKDAWVPIVTLPKNSVLHAITFERRQDFDGATNRLDIGDGTSVFFLNNGDISGTNNGMLTIPVLLLGKQAIARNITVRYRATGTPTKGQLIVRVEWSPSRIDPVL